MLTGHAFNAMLKTLEEPPEHVKFILATTDPQKIPVTVLSRCLQFNLKQMPQGHIVDHLTRILQAEEVAFEPGALRHLAKAAAASMRDALSLLDQAIAHGAGRVEEEQVTHMLGTVGRRPPVCGARCARAGDVPALLAVADGMEARSLSFDAALQALATLVASHRAGPVRAGGDRRRGRARAYPRLRQALRRRVPAARLPDRDPWSRSCRLAPDEYTGFTMTLLRLHAFRLEQPAALVGRGAGPDAGREMRQAAGRAGTVSAAGRGGRAFAGCPSHGQFAARPHRRPAFRSRLLGRRCGMPPRAGSAGGCAGCSRAGRLFRRRAARRPPMRSPRQRWPAVTPRAGARPPARRAPNAARLGARRRCAQDVPP